MIHGPDIAACSAGKVVRAMGLSGFSKSAISKLCRDMDERVHDFPDRPPAGDRPCLRLDATCLKLREGGRMASVAAMIAVAVNTDGRREIIGLRVGPSEEETFWTEFLHRLKARGLDGLNAAIARVFDATGRRRPVRWMRNALAHVPKARRTVVVAAIRQGFNQPDQKGAIEVRRHVAGQLRPRWPKLAALMDDSEADVLACMAFPVRRRAKLHGAKPLERLDKEVKRRANVVGIVPNEAGIIRLIGAVLFEQTDDWQSHRRHMQIEAFSQIDAAQIDSLLGIATQAA